MALGALLAAAGPGHAAPATGTTAATTQPLPSGPTQVLLASGGRFEALRVTEQGDWLRLDLKAGGHVVVPRSQVRRLTPIATLSPAVGGEVVIRGGQPATPAELRAGMSEVSALSSPGEPVVAGGGARAEGRAFPGRPGGAGFAAGLSGVPEPTSEAGRDRVPTRPVGLEQGLMAPPALPNAPPTPESIRGLLQRVGGQDLRGAPAGGRAPITGRSGHDLR